MGHSDICMYARSWLLMHVVQYGAGRLMWSTDCPYQIHQHKPPFNPNAQAGQTYDESIALIRDRADFLSKDEKHAILGLTAERVFFAPAPIVYGPAGAAVSTPAL